MAGISINRITEANVYLNGRSLLGQVESIDLPEIKIKMTEHKALGLIGTVEFPSGLEKLEAKLKWNSFYAETLMTVANPMQTVQLQVRGSVETWTSAGRTGEASLVSIMTVLFKKQSLGNFKKADNVELGSEMAVYYIQTSIGQDKIMEIDPMANIWWVGKKDILSKYRINIGG